MYRWSPARVEACHSNIPVAEGRRCKRDVRAQRGNDVIIVLVGNKTDLVSQREVSAAEIEQRANEQEIMFIETSAKEGFNIKLLFRRLATVRAAPPPEERRDTTVVQLTTAPPADAKAAEPAAASGGGCC